MTELPKNYEPKDAEGPLYKKWEESGFFRPEGQSASGGNPDAKHFSIVLPPPNVTGTLHMGHAAMLAIQDILIRYHRMKGDVTLWLPGTDHAAIATQSKVEKEISKKEGKSRHDLGREELLRRVNEFAQASHDTIVNQMKRMGASLDWSREAFTLDAPRTAAVYEAFKRMHEAGLIYRGHRIVNWDPKGQTTISDDEIVYEEKKDKFYYFKYGPFTIGTARPETKFADKYVVMHPDDPRYASYKHGDVLDIEWINGPIQATVIKDEVADQTFGSGVMTITPWHSAEDFALAEKYQLEKQQIIDERGKLLPVAGEFAGMKITEAREKIVEKLKSKGLLVKVDEAYVHNVATAERTGGIIEPQIKLQWFVAVNKKFKIPHSNIKGIASGSEVTLKELMLAAVQGGDIAITPDRFNAVYFHWINNLRDWCISRQIWYGHRVPVWYCAGCGKEKVSPEVKGKWLFVRHGETDWNVQKRFIGHAQEGLNDTGKAQAAASAGRLKAEKIDVIISSDLARTRETAEIIAEQIGFPKEKIIFDAAFRERSYGEAEGVLHTEADERFGNLFQYDKKAPGGESYADVEKRAWDAIKKYKGDHHSKNVLIVTHAGTLRTVLKNIQGLTPEQMLARDSVKNGVVLSFDVHHECEKCGSDLFEQDPDTLDTWFSSGLWTFSTLGWPNQTDDLKRFHPTAVLETGYDIIFFWVARMILMSGFLLGEVPFKQVYLHGLVRDAKGQKMSKSLGNALDPLELADKYGADATRLSLIIGTSAGNDQKLSEDKVRGYKNFANKIWNISRFVLMNFDGFNPDVAGEITNETDKAAVAEFEKAKVECTAAIEAFNFHAAAEGMYHYVWHTFADKVIEEAKPRLVDPATRASAQAMLWYILTGSLKALHPFMPFVTEEIWSKLPEWKGKTMLIVEKW